MRLPAQALVRSLYFAFRILTGLRTTHLPDHATPLIQAGLTRIAHHHFLAGLLTTELWQPITTCPLDLSSRSEATLPLQVLRRHPERAKGKDPRGLPPPPPSPLSAVTSTQPIRPGAPSLAASRAGKRSPRSIHPAPIHAKHPRKNFSRIQTREAYNSLCCAPTFSPPPLPSSSHRSPQSPDQHRHQLPQRCPALHPRRRLHHRRPPRHRQEIPRRHRDPHLQKPHRPAPHHLPFHLYLNAFRPESTFTRETHFNGGIRDYGKRQCLSR